MSVFPIFGSLEGKYWIISVRLGARGNRTLGDFSSELRRPVVEIKTIYICD